MDDPGETVKKISWLFLAAAVLAPPALRAHIGSPAAIFDGTAGPYPVRVIVLPPPVVPGRAEINIRLLEDEPDPVKITVLPVNWRTGVDGAPPPDVALPVSGEPSLRHAELWLMTSGSYSVQVTVSGVRGSGLVIVPVLSVATERLPMSEVLSGMLTALGALLFVGAVMIVHAGARDSGRAADAPPTRRQVRHSYLATAAAILVFALLLYEGKRWWDADDRNYRTNEIYRALPLAATPFQAAGGQEVINLRVADDADDPGSPLLLIPDHGKLMHLFMIREPQLDALAHLHPLPSVSPQRRFLGIAVSAAAGGALPPLHADLTYETGFAATLTTTVDLPDTTGVPEAAGPVRHDPDDSWFVGTPASSASGDYHLVRTGPTAIQAGQDLTLRFTVQDRAGQPIALEPYLGMLGTPPFVAPTARSSRTSIPLERSPWPRRCSSWRRPRNRPGSRCRWIPGCTCREPARRRPFPFRTSSPSPAPTASGCRPRSTARCSQGPSISTWPRRDPQAAGRRAAT